MPSLLGSAAGLALVLFSSGMLSARSFAAKGRYDIDADRELAAFGAANLASALSQGFAVTGADSRTAVADAAGGRTQVTGLVAAATIAIILLFLTRPLQYIPIAALGALLVYASLSLFDARSLREYWRIDRMEVGLAVITTLGVVAMGAIDGIVIAVGLALVRFVQITARPKDEVLGAVEGLSGLHSIERHPGARRVPGLLLYRFDAPLTFFNADYFKTRALALADEAGPGLRWFVVDAIPISGIDLTGLYALRDLRQRLEERGALLILAGRKTELLMWLRKAGLYRPEHEKWCFPTLRQALKAYQRETNAIGPQAGDNV
jgi:MFS superfamily sulfate permease-like transporter